MVVNGHFSPCVWSPKKQKKNKNKKKQLISIIIYSAAFTKEITARKESIDNYNKIGKQYW